MSDLTSLLDQLRALLTKNIDLRGRRVINAGRSIDASDYVRRDEISGLAPSSESKVFDTAPEIHHASHQNGGSDEINVAGLSGLLADPQTPLGHHTSHESGGADSIKLDDLASPDDNVDLNVSTTKHGLTPKLSNDGSTFLSGLGTWLNPLFKPLFDHFVNAGNGTTVETDLYSDVIPALTGNGDKLVIQYGGIFVGSATATRQIKAYFAGTAFFDSGSLAVGTNGDWALDITIIRVSATVVRIISKLTDSTASLALQVTYAELTGLTLSGTNILKITGTSAGVGAATDDIVAKLGSVIYFKAA